MNPNIYSIKYPLSTNPPSPLKNSSATMYLIFNSFPWTRQRTRIYLRYTNNKNISISSTHLSYFLNTNMSSNNQVKQHFPIIFSYYVYLCWLWYLQKNPSMHFLCFQISAAIYIYISITLDNTMLPTALIYFHIHIYYLHKNNSAHIFYLPAHIYLTWLNNSAFPLNFLGQHIAALHFQISIFSDKIKSVFNKIYLRK